jgi:hypothetical protein
MKLHFHLGLHEFTENPAGGPTRGLRAAIDVGIRDVPVCFHDFESEDEAFEYAVASQVARRNLTDAEIYRVTKELDRRRSRGAQPGFKGNRAIANEASCGASLDGPRFDTSYKKMAEETARKVGTYVRKVEAVRAIIDNAAEFPEIEQAVLDGKESIRMAETAHENPADLAGEGCRTAGCRWRQGEPGGLIGDRPADRIKYERLNVNPGYPAAFDQSS